MNSRRARVAVLAVIALATGCAVAPLPKTVPMRGQSALEQAWDVSDCKAEISYQTHYSPTDSPLGNWFQALFFWGTSGAALGAAITGWPTPAVIVTGPGPTVVPSVTAQTSEGVIAGAALSIAIHPTRWLDTLLGIVLGGGLFFLIILVSGGGMGGGDMKLGAMMGAFLGWKLVLLAILLGVFAGGAVAVVLLVTGSRGRKDPVPFGPFLALGAVLSLLWGNGLLEWYLGRFFE